LRTLDRSCQKSRKPARRQETTVLAFTRINASAQPANHRWSNPEQAIQTTRSGTGLLALEHRQLLAQSGDLERETVPRHDESVGVGECWEINKRFSRCLLPNRSVCLDPADFGSNGEHERDHQSDTSRTEPARPEPSCL
jgi:hypothetical protein